MKKKITAICLVVALAAVAIVGATLAYFTDTTDVVENTFTVGKVKLKLDEDIVDAYGTIIGGRTEEGNEYKLIPGHTYAKDPTTTVLSGSEPCYVRMKVKVDGLGTMKNVIDAEKHPEFYAGDLFLLQQLVVDENGVSTWDSSKWVTDYDWGL